jgi:hypothetical protein
MLPPSTPPIGVTREHTIETRIEPAPPAAPATPLLASPPVRAGARSAATAAARPESPALPPPIEVVIGRIEIRADAPPAKTARSPATRRPTMSLDDYLRGRGSAR